MNKQGIIVYENEPVGLGSTIFRGLHRLYYRSPEEVLYFEFKNPLYGNKNIWSTYLFQPFEKEKDFLIDYQKKGLLKIENGVFSNPSFPLLFGYGKQQNNGVAFTDKNTVEKYRTFALQYLNFLPKIKDKAFEYYEREIKGHKTLSLHKRGTDQFIIGRGHAGNSAHLFSDEYVIDIVKDIEKDYNKIFVATDDGIFLQKFIKHFEAKTITYSKIKSLDNSSHLGLHFQHYNSNNDLKYILGEEVIVDSILMSMCDYSLFMRSNVSLMSILLRKDYNYNFIDDHIDYGDLG